MLVPAEILYVIGAVLLLLMWRHARTWSLNTLFQRDVDLHHHVHAVIKSHPHLGTWDQYTIWTKETPAPQHED